MDSFDCLIKGGRVLDPETGLDARLDIAITGKTIAAISASIPQSASRISPHTRIIDVSGRLVTPGLVDMHCHFYPDDYYGLMPDDAGVLSGCTSIVDGGSAGILTYAYFASKYMSRSKSKTYAFLLHHPIGQFFQEENWKNVSVNAGATADFIRHHPRIVGLKDKLTADFAWYQGVEGIRRSIDIAHNSGKVYAVHLGTSPSLIVPDPNASVAAVASAVRECTFELLALLRKGDIIFHAFTGKLGGLFTPEGTFDNAVEDALKRGVLLDASPGRANFDLTCYDLARQKGILPQIISSDLVQFGLQDCVFNLGAVLSRFVGNGLDLQSAVANATLHPAQAARLAPGTGKLFKGGPADITISTVETGEFLFTDKTNGTLFTGRQLIRPQLCFVDGTPYTTWHHGLDGTSPLLSAR